MKQSFTDNLSTALAAGQTNRWTHTHTHSFLFSVVAQQEVRPVFFQARQLVKDGFLVEVSESSRKVRHVFLFTDLLLCAKMKKTSVG